MSPLEEAVRLSTLSDADLENELEERQSRYQRLRELWTTAAERLSDAEANVQRERTHVLTSGSHRPDVAGCHDVAVEHAEHEREEARKALEALKRERGGTHPEQAGSSEVAAAQREIDRRKAHGRLDQEQDVIARRKRTVDRLAGVST